jgi:hypothetical protein
MEGGAGAPLAEADGQPGDKGANAAKDGPERGELGDDVSKETLLELVRTLQEDKRKAEQAVGRFFFYLPRHTCLLITLSCRPNPS